MSQNNASSQSSPPPEGRNLADQELANWLKGCAGAGHQVVWLQSGFLCRMLNREEHGTPLHTVDPQVESKKILKSLAKRRLLQHIEVQLESLEVAQRLEDDWDVTLITPPQVDALIAIREGALGRATGRGVNIDDKTAQKVWADAGGRCMFEGCAEDLTEIPLWTKSARLGYLAHIIASDPMGPRGTQADSHRRSNDPENIMLMCDGHHRLIDSFAPSFYTADVLFEMRRQHTEMVRSYLNSLAFPRTRAVTLHANLAYVPTYFHDSDFIEAILATRRAMTPTVLHYIRRTSQRDDRNSKGFWANYLREHEGEIRRLIAGFNTSNGPTSEALAVFPLHHIPTLVLAGRIMGEAQAIQIFQYNKDRRTWAWDSQVSPKPDGSIGVSPLPQDKAEEVLITIELTTEADEKAIPEELRAKIATGDLPWVRITTPTPRFNCISHPADLEQFASIARKTIDHVQDVMRVSTVHLIAVSPASTVFRFGQMLQAGHHPDYVVYDRAGRDYPFVPAFRISGHSVSAPDSEHNFSIALR